MLRWFGYIDRMDSVKIVKQIYESDMDESRTRTVGRSKRTWLDGVNETLKKNSILSTTYRRMRKTKRINVDELKKICGGTEGIVKSIRVRD